MKIVLKLKIILVLESNALVLLIIYTTDFNSVSVICTFLVNLQICELLYSLFSK